MLVDVKVPTAIPSLAEAVPAHTLGSLDGINNNRDTPIELNTSRKMFSSLSTSQI